MVEQAYAELLCIHRRIRVLHGWQAARARVDRHSHLARALEEPPLLLPRRTFSPMAPSSSRSEAEPAERDALPAPAPGAPCMACTVGKQGGTRGR